MKNSRDYEQLCISAYGAITPLGNTLEEISANLYNGVSGISEIKKFDHHSLASSFAGIPLEGNQYIRWPKKNRFRNGEIFYAERAAKDLLQRLNISTLYPANEIGCIIGSDEPAIDVEQCIEFTRQLSASPDRKELIEKAIEHFRVSDLLDLESGAVLKAIHNLLPYAGVSFVHMGLCSASTQSIGLAMRAINSGEINAAIVGGVSAKVTPVNLARLEGMGVVSTDNCYAGQQRSRPFERNRSGFMLAEGAVLFTIEKQSTVLSRGDKPLMTLMGYGSSLCAENIVAPHQDDLEMKLSMERALEDAGIERDKIDFVSAHGTSTRQNDLHESRAIASVFGAHKPAVIATKGHHGHLIAAAGAMELLTVITSFQNNFLPGILNLEQPDPELSEYVTLVKKNKHQPLNYALKNSFGMGGSAASLVVANPLNQQGVSLC
ncbi:beta-ketoacyl-[acyl-carrier-protein] synthase family protein [Pantoea dispersa]|uniref:beta-ketoacyl-[acyl-carrier-protein] synthase family protein n=1 Tax=Pantoea dispersa TaxID=59814 RepID=UPI001BA7886F|nr:beta-ketoacyl-[acyl-carrier-protein] synthase family protein [Pantoea dispersa]MBS0899806.1 beta-ketoacyl-[acyl-carrier-protein] synthase family protein [Pantoea dispersa]MBS0907638.1 beta-ketoacyl-[acyl-carrier-protein] synthase family protein [Pantoea dispersa]